MSLAYDKELRCLARSLRRDMTDAEHRLWSAIRRKQVHGRLFSRQKTIGRYIVDFFCASATLVIELDGGQHHTEEGREKDRQRDCELNRLGLTVLRFTDHEVLTNMRGVLEKIWTACEGAIKPPLSPFRKGDTGGLTELRAPAGEEVQQGRQ